MPTASPRESSKRSIVSTRRRSTNIAGCCGPGRRAKMMPDSDLPPIPTREEVEAAAVRRRWITLAEVLGVIAVLISGLTLWNSYRQRSDEEADKAAARSQAAAEAQVLLLRATPDRDGRILSLAS